MFCLCSCVNTELPSDFPPSVGVDVTALLRVNRDEPEHGTVGGACALLGGGRFFRAEAVLFIYEGIRNLLEGVGRQIVK